MFYRFLDDNLPNMYNIFTFRCIKYRFYLLREKFPYSDHESKADNQLYLREVGGGVHLNNT